MTDTINLKAKSPEAIVVLRAMFLAERNRKGIRVKEWSSSMLMAEVKLTVQGIEVPFTEALRELLDEEQASIEERAREMALQMVSAAGLDPALEALRTANFKIKRALSEVVVPD